MKKTHIHTLCFLAALLTLSAAGGRSYAQQNTKRVTMSISSLVTDDEGTPIAGAVVYGNEGSRMAVTDHEGHFSITVYAGTPIYIEAEGYEPATVEYASEESITLQQSKYLYGHDDIVDIAFDKVMKGDLATASATVFTKDFANEDRAQSVWELIRGRIPGLIGNDNIRGIGNALIVVDGFPRDASSLSVDEIAQVSVLKDAAATALYGTQARNGVILITTKRGEAHKRNINISVDKGISLPKALPHYLGSGDYMKLFNEALANDGLEARYSDEQIDLYLSGANAWRYPDVDYYSPEFLDSYRNTTHIVAEFSGGNDNTRYYTNMGWENKESLIGVGDKGASNRFNVRGNIDFALNDYIHSHLDAVVAFDTDKNPNGNFWGNASTLHPYYYAPLIPVNLIEDPTQIETAHRVFGDYILGGTTQYRSNVYGDLCLSGYSQNIRRTSQFNGGIDFDLSPVVKGLQLKTWLSFDFYNSYNQNVTDSYAVYTPTWGEDGTVTALAKIGDDVSNGVQNLGSGSMSRCIGFYGLLDYDRTFMDVHHISSQLLGYSFTLNENSVLQSRKDNHLGWHASYDYDRRYYAALSAVLAHSVKLPVGGRQGLSPTLSLAWIPSNESWWNGNGTFPYLKLYANGGYILTDVGIGTHVYDESYWNDGSFAWGDGNYSGNITKAGRSANPNLTFEKMYNMNTGFLASMFHHSLTIEAAAFWYKYADRVVRRYNYYPSFTSVFFPDENWEADSWYGVEASAVWKKTMGDFGVDFGANILWRNSNVDIQDELWQNDYQYRAGRPTDAIFGYVCEGFFRDQADINGSPAQSFGEVKPGDLKYADLNGDNVIDSNDQKMIGNSMAHLSGGISMTLRYRGLSLFALAEGRTGYQYLQSGSYYWNDGDDKYSEMVLGRWTPDTADDATYPRLSSKTNDNNYRNSTFWLKDGKYLSLSRLQLTWQLPQGMFSKIPIRGASLYLRGSDLIMLSKDARLRSINVGSEPQYRNVALGLRMLF